MRLLLDTHIALWWLDADPRLSPAAVTEIGRARSVLVSAASVWEVAIKVSIGKLRLPEPFEVAVVESGFSPLPVAFAHAAAVAALPLHHRDPFDRLLIAQARTEGLTLVTHDEQFRPYDVPVIWT